MNPEEMMQQCMQKMQEAGVPKEMISKWRMMMKTPISADSPAALAARVQELGLSKEQLSELDEIEDKACEKALDVLTPEQQVKALANIAPAESKPKSAMPMMDMCMSFRSKMMQNMMGGSNSTDSTSKGG